MKKKRRKGRVLPKPPLPKKTSFIHRLKFLMKKAQTAMEYVLTYGWAVLIILFAISSLFYIGVFEPKTPNTCIIEAPFICNDVKAYDDTIIYTLNSQNVKTATVTDVLINGESCSSISELGDLSLIINPGSNSYNVNSQNEIICTGLEQDLYQKASSEIILNYETQQGLQHTITGTSSANIEGLGSEFVLDYTLLDDPTMAVGFNFEDGLEILGNYAGNPPINNGVTFEEEEIIGQVAIFNGINSSIEIGNQPILNTRLLTIEFLIKVEEPQIDNYPVFTKAEPDPGTNYSYEVIVDTSPHFGAKLFAQYGPNQGQDMLLGLDSLTYLNFNEWYHVAIVFNGRDLRIYINGELDGTSSQSCLPEQPFTNCIVLPSNANLLIGKGRYSNYFKGRLDSIVIYDRVLSPDEIKKHYEHFTPPS